MTKVEHDYVLEHLRLLEMWRSNLEGRMLITIGAIGVFFTFLELGLRFIK